jgi:hypothetical protein
MTVKTESNIHEQHQKPLFSWNTIDLTTILQRTLNTKNLKAEKYRS